MAVPPQHLTVLGEARLGLVPEREQRLLGAEPPTRLREGHDLVGRERARAGLARIAPEGAVAAVVAAERGEGHEDLGREGHGTAAAAVAHLAGARAELGEALGRRLDQRARLRVRDHARLRGSRARTASAKRSMFASTARRSGTVGSKTKWLTPTAA